MILLKVLLTEQQIAEYVQPSGTRDYDCGAGINCAFCALKMMGIYTKGLNEKAMTCGSRFREGRPISPAELLPPIKEFIQDVTEEEHEFKFEQAVGNPRVSLGKLAVELKPMEACYFIYGSNKQAHAVVLRRGVDGILELIDPQRGEPDVGKMFGFTAQRVAELGIEIKPNYYRVRGDIAIEEAMIEQSVLFGYWPSKEAVIAGLDNFIIATLLVDNVVGLKMLIDDSVVSTPMEVDGGSQEGGRTMIPSKAAETPGLQVEIIKRDWKDAIIREMSWTTEDGQEFVPKYEDILDTDEDGTPVIERTYLDEQGNPIMDGGSGKRKREEESPPAGEPTTKRARTELSIEDIKRTPEQKAEAEAILSDILKPEVEGVGGVDSAVTAVVKHFYKAQDRGLFETQPPDLQCEGVFGKHEVESEICWLCGFAQVAYAGDGKPYGPDEGGDPLDVGTITNEGALESSVCEHKLPVKVAHFFGLMYRSSDMKYGQIDQTQYERIQKLYGTAHIICNIIKDNDRFLKSTLGNKTFGAFTENKPVIEKCMKNLLSVVRKRTSTTQTISEILPGSRFYYWGTLLMKQTGEGRTYYRNTLMYRLHKMETFKVSQNPYRATALERVPPGATGIAFTGKLTYPSVEAVKKWLDIQYTNIVGGINELRVLLDSDRDTLYTEGVQVMNRKPYRENTEWWDLVKQYVPTHPDEAEEFKHGLRLPFTSLIKDPKYKPIQRVWKRGDILPQSSKPENATGGGGRLRVTIRRRKRRGATVTLKVGGRPRQA